MPAPLTEDQTRQDGEVLLDAAEALFYEKGFRAVGMDEVRAASGLPLKRIYRLHPAKDDLVVAVLRRRDLRWRARLTAAVERAAEPRARLLAAFDWLGEWFAEPGYRGCAWINAFGELGPASPAVLAEVRAHKDAFHALLDDWARAAGLADPAPVRLLAEGAIVTAAIGGDPAPARQARAAVQALLDAAR
ncbi:MULTISPECIES: TetR/AcrR family transcriptional regulator [Kitasatospora]|uniref:Putative TetR family transcriptional regulator n=1 Tax=Kitasatospora setae (strain ATCC 33774 / DSM 43861 / JCM 3304 / KCC A-0304 / NBRC 14216 / KM-6054) TaxID=452652 RepID=E4N6H4_KITSK|nr:MULTISPECIES: TetR/AcrR family transcriptional regulator [Kitasatospora]BAJ26805.1 putative TetR family transcriptional regulator [Kitasatospora setae KM-6054]